MVHTANGHQTARKATTTNSSSKTDLESHASGPLKNGLGVAARPELVTKNGLVRHFLAILALSAIVMANMNRQAYNQALVRMIKKPADRFAATESPSTTVETTPLASIQAEDSAVDRDAFEPNLMVARVEPIHRSDEARLNSTDEDGFDWSGSQISLLQAGFSYGYTLFMIPGGRLSEIYGSKWVIFVSGFGSALCSMFTPFIASQSYGLLVASRVFMGLCQTGVSPALYAFCTRWLPPEESSVYLPLIKVGVMIGFMLGSLINGFLPWRIMFYVVGTAGFVWSLVWACFASSEPHQQRFISAEELAYIQYRLGQRRAQTKQSAVKSRPPSAPWWGILTNRVVIAFTLTKFTVKLSTDTQTMQLPMYLRNVFQVTDSLNGILNGANFAIQACFTGLVAYSAKEIVLRKPFGLNKTGVRILFQGINNMGMALGYFLISMNMGSLELVCCAVITLSVASMFGSGGEAVLPVDLTTEYAASIMAIANSFANLSGVVMPPIVSFFLDNHLTSSARWNHVWWFVSATMFCGGLVFALFVRAKVQNFGEKEDEEINAKEKRVEEPKDSFMVLGSDPSQTETTKL